MTDIRRTVLWVVFTMSLVLLWDGWQKHNGHPSMFSPTPKTVSTAPGAGSTYAGTPTAARLSSSASESRGSRSTSAPHSADERPLSRRPRGGGGALSMAQPVAAGACARTKSRLPAKMVGASLSSVATW